MIRWKLLSDLLSLDRYDAVLYTSNKTGGFWTLVSHVCAGENNTIVPSAIFFSNTLINRVEHDQSLDDGGVKNHNVI